MKSASLKRVPSADAGTFGVLTFGHSNTYALELPWRDNRQQRSCIPAGSYRCALVRSPKFGLVYQLHDVPGRGHILIHPANLAGDIEKGLDSQLEGCIALGTRLGAIKNTAGRMQPAVLVSRPAVRSFMEWSGGQPFTMEIENDLA